MGGVETPAVVRGFHLSLDILNRERQLDLGTVQAGPRHISQKRSSVAG
jgi:hypothetical protein